MRTPPRSPIPIVKLVIVFENSVSIVIPIEWHKGITPLGVLVRASDKPHGITFRVKGSGNDAFIIEIDGQSNDSGAYYWMYSINGRKSEVGCGQYELKPNDIVRWEFTAYDKRLNQR